MALTLPAFKQRTEAGIQNSNRAIDDLQRVGYLRPRTEERRGAAEKSRIRASPDVGKGASTARAPTHWMNDKSKPRITTTATKTLNSQRAQMLSITKGELLLVMCVKQGYIICQTTDCQRGWVVPSSCDELKCIPAGQPLPASMQVKPKKAMPPPAVSWLTQMRVRFTNDEEWNSHWCSHKSCGNMMGKPDPLLPDDLLETSRLRIKDVWADMPKPKKHHYRANKKEMRESQTLVDQQFNEGLAFVAAGNHDGNHVGNHDGNHARDGH
jgi:hypothetical protein